MQLPNGQSPFMVVNNFSVVETPPAPATDVPRRKTIAFFGVTFGCGLATLMPALKDNQTCLCLMEVPAALESIAFQWPNLILLQGSMTDEVAVAHCLTNHAENRLVDAISFVIETIPNPLGDQSVVDLDICKNGIACILRTLDKLRRRNVLSGPIIAALGTIALPELKPQYLVAVFPGYYHILARLRADKKAMERLLHRGSELFVVIRPNFLLEGLRTENIVEERMEDVIQEGEGRTPVGYAISRDAVGYWIYEKVLRAGITYMEGTAISIGW